MIKENKTWLQIYTMVFLHWNYWKIFDIILRMGFSHCTGVPIVINNDHVQLQNKYKNKNPIFVGAWGSVGGHDHFWSKSNSSFIISFPVSWCF